MNGKKLAENTLSPNSTIPGIMTLHKNMLNNTMNPTGTYHYHKEFNYENGSPYSYSGTLHVKKISDYSVLVSLLEVKSPNANIAYFVDTLEFTNNMVTNKNVNPPKSSCEVRFFFRKNSVDIFQSGGACFGAGVHVQGTFTKTTSYVADNLFE